MHCRNQFKTYKHYPNIKLIKEHIQKENKKAARRLQKAAKIKAASVGQTKKMIKGLTPKKAIGSDKIPVKIVKLAASVIDSHLANKINNDLSNNAFSDSAKTASARPIYKTDDRNEIKNY